ncbi:MAG: HXXEE domain-containing protein [Chitinophagales bacterium]|nr:HXXEE domain-containing protein [Chitinophagales bacterium]
MKEIAGNKFYTIIAALLFTLGLLAVGYFSFGIWTTFIFASGFLGGFILWLFAPNTASFASIRKPYWFTLAALILLHRVEEYIFKFQEELAKMTGNPIPDLTSPALIALVLASVGGWLFIPYLIKRSYSFGYYLAWTFFAAMGIAELAHFIFPFFTHEPYGYFPGMASVIVLAPTAWWGMRRLSRVPR